MGEMLSAALGRRTLVLVSFEMENDRERGLEVSHGQAQVPSQGLCTCRSLYLECLAIRHRPGSLPLLLQTFAHVIFSVRLPHHLIKVAIHARHSGLCFSPQHFSPLNALCTTE